ncbi:hypothetical protein FBU31_004058 [Coemansia sp. 'formosensis']|nr:hypothetical protein FBU31_004058 [Coemansia sp. 'formosensis']
MEHEQHNVSVSIIEMQNAVIKNEDCQDDACNDWSMQSCQQVINIKMLEAFCPNGANKFCQHAQAFTGMVMSLSVKEWMADTCILLSIYMLCTDEEEHFCHVIKLLDLIQNEKLWLL